jgi:hypothetical protein
MSFVKREKATALNSHFQISLVPDPAQRFSDEKKLAQQAVIEQVTKVSKGLFHPNPAVRVLDSTKSGQFYNAGIPVSKLTHLMKENDLVLRVSMKGDCNACAMARHSDLGENSVISSPSGSFALGLKNGFIRTVDFL